jgi:hypothetical protein
MVLFDGAMPKHDPLKGLLKKKFIDGLVHMTFLDQSDDVVHDKLKKMGASQVTRKSMSLNEAVNAFLTRRHAAPKTTLKQQ